jgi:hypothetical protein
MVDFFAPGAARRLRPACAHVRIQIRICSRMSFDVLPASSSMPFPKPPLAWVCTQGRVLILRTSNWGDTHASAAVEHHAARAAWCSSCTHDEQCTSPLSTVVSNHVTHVICCTHGCIRVLIRVCSSAGAHLHLHLRDGILRHRANGSMPVSDTMSPSQNAS